ncbi:multicopper oxidase domain-containing protein [Actinoplanes subtropicus]|uniref:multicopper oxidase domain-containing protein n=1 Tax=Actinoplanes subtropicus TaxID=543632 RepID=UPI0006892549|nr:multicopper oxidase domain-containing protein [Actinoplanes subtropicus]
MTTRRDFLYGVAGTLAVGVLVGDTGSAAAATTGVSLVATDGYISVPGREGNPLYVFGFVRVDPALTVAQLESTYKGHAQHTAPTLDLRQDDDIKITLTNLGFVQRPDLVDSHTVHWHGFDLPTPLNDGVPEVSVAVPVNKQFTYFYRPHREGTYMYHCHFEDVEHVQMGMTGVVFVRPRQDGTAFGGFTRFAYNDGDGSTGYHRHFAILLNELWRDFHDGDRDIQETIPTDYDPHWFTLNGRTYPQTTLPNDDPALPAALRIGTPNPNYDDAVDHSQPNSALIQVNPGERVLLRLANLGYQQHSMQLPGIPLHVIGQDAAPLRAASYWTNTLYLGPGEARDVLFDAPAYDPARPSGSDTWGAYNVYFFKNRDWRRLQNFASPAPGPGGMMTEVRVYAPARPLPAQTVVSQTYV